MKTLIDGRPGVKPWWVGGVVQCGRCGWTVEMEEGDEQHPLTGARSCDAVNVECAQCQSVLMLSTLQAEKQKGLRARGFSHEDKEMTPWIRG